MTQVVRQLALLAVLGAGVSGAVFAPCSPVVAPPAAEDAAPSGLPAAEGARLHLTVAEAGETRWRLLLPGRPGAGAAGRALEDGLQALADARVERSTPALEEVLLGLPPGLVWSVATRLVVRAAGRPSEVATYWLRATDGGWTRVTLPTDSCRTKRLELEPGLEVALALGVEPGSPASLRLDLRVEEAALSPDELQPVVVRQEDAPGPSRSPASRLDLLRLEPGRLAPGSLDRLEARLSRVLEAGAPWSARLAPAEAGADDVRSGEVADLIQRLAQRGARFVLLAGGWPPPADRAAPGEPAPVSPFPAQPAVGGSRR